MPSILSLALSFFPSFYLSLVASVVVWFVYWQAVQEVTSLIPTSAVTLYFFLWFPVNRAEHLSFVSKIKQWNDSIARDGTGKTAAGACALNIFLQAYSGGELPRWVESVYELKFSLSDVTRYLKVSIHLDVWLIERRKTKSCVRFYNTSM